MKTRNIRLPVAVMAVLVTAGIVASAAARLNDVTQETGPAYSLEGAWYGTASLAGLPPVPTLDNFTSAAQKPGVEGSVLCTIPVMTLRHPDHPTDPQYWLTMAPSGHGNWVRVGTNAFAYTAVRTLVDQSGVYFGRGRNWGTFTAPSENEFSGTMTFRFYRADGTPFGRTFTGVANSTRVEITYEE